jgi:hypothetical protein
MINKKTDDAKLEGSVLNLAELQKKIEKEFSAGYPNVEIEGRSLEEWKNYFEEPLPQEFNDGREVRRVLVSLQRKLDTATRIESYIKFYLKQVETEESAQLHNYKVEALKTRKSVNYAENYGKLLAAEKSLQKKMVETMYLFWNDIVKALKVKISTVTAIAYNMNAELKVLGSTGGIVGDTDGT